MLTERHSKVNFLLYTLVYLKKTTMRNVLPSIRPIIHTKNHALSAYESFQNQTLRPILKFQNELIISILRQQLHKRKDVFYSLPQSERPHYLENTIRQDLRFKILLIGLIIGHFTAEEFSIYTKHEAELSRRLTNLLLRRVVSQIDSL